MPRRVRSTPRSGAFAADLARYGSRPLRREQSLWAVAVYRFGQWGDRQPSPVVRWLADRSYWLAFRVVETATGVSFTKATVIGPGLRIHHFGGIFVNERARIGSRCTLRQGVTIGSVTDGGPAPVLGDDVELGAYAQLLGGITVGAGARIGAMSVVLDDVPAGATAVGVPARVIPARDEPSGGIPHDVPPIVVLDGQPYVRRRGPDRPPRAPDRQEVG